MANTATKKKRLNFENAKQAAKPTGLHILSAIGGGLVGAISKPWLSGFTGVATILVGETIKQPILTSFGGGMLASVPMAVASGNLQTAPNGKFDLKTEMHNSKEKAKAFFDALSSKFFLDKVFKKKEPSTKTDLEGLGYLNDPNFDALDTIEQEMIASAMDFQANTAPGLMPPTDEEVSVPMIGKDYALAGEVDFDFM
ncbi:MAG: hypothetical protein AAGN35_15280 [Bacteroidota bacterium]